MIRIKDVPSSMIRIKDGPTPKAWDSLSLSLSFFFLFFFLVWEEIFIVAESN